MDPIVFAFLLVNALLLLSVPRRWAPLPILMAACWMTRGQTLDVGPVSFTVVRVLVLVGLARITIKKEWLRDGFNSLDAIMAAFGVWMIVSVIFHPNPDSPLMLRTRDVYEAWGLYLLFRIFIQSREDLEHVIKMLAVLLVPIAFEMTLEKMSGNNFFARFGGVPLLSALRNGSVRAQGPWAHAILAGSIGGVCMPLMLGLWRNSRLFALIGFAACLGIVRASGSSGPIIAMGAALAVLCIWPLRERMRAVRWAAIAGYVALDIVMKRPAYFVISDIDLTGGSTAWHRAELIRTAIAHFDEWWLVGTDYTRHWMASGLSANPNQVDITNHYIGMGVVGGVLLMLLFMAMMLKAFWLVGEGVRATSDRAAVFQSWTIGAALFAHAATCLSVSYFDHSILFLYLTFAAAVVVKEGPASATNVAAPAPVPVNRRSAIERVRVRQRPASVAAPSPSHMAISHD